MCLIAVEPERQPVRRRVRGPCRPPGEPQADLRRAGAEQVFALDLRILHRGRHGPRLAVAAAGYLQHMTRAQQTEQRRDELTQEELDSLYAEALPEREAMSVLRVPFLSGAPVEPEEADLPDE